MRRDRHLEEAARLVEYPFAEQRSPDLQHQIVVVAESQGEDAVEAGDRARAVAELEQHFAEPRQGVFVVGVEGDRLLERAPRPGELLPRQPGVAHAHMQLDGVGVQPQALAEHFDRLVVLSVVVQLVCAFVVFVGA